MLRLCKTWGHENPITLLHQVFKCQAHLSYSVTSSSSNLWFTGSTHTHTTEGRLHTQAFAEKSAHSTANKHLNLTASWAIHPLLLWLEVINHPPLCRHTPPAHLHEDTHTHAHNSINLLWLAEINDATIKSLSLWWISSRHQRFCTGPKVTRGRSWWQTLTATSLLHSDCLGVLAFQAQRTVCVWDWRFSPLASNHLYFTLLPAIYQNTSHLPGSHCCQFRLF